QRLLELLGRHVLAVFVSAIVLGRARCHFLGHGDLLARVVYGVRWRGSRRRAIGGPLRRHLFGRGWGRRCWRGCGIGGTHAARSAGHRQISHHFRLLLTTTCDDCDDITAYCNEEQHKSIQKRLHS
ncbi:hypothetical protein PFISCL1PPCAC_21109, partial [Pristionchus fissidentatus]